MPSAVKVHNLYPQQGQACQVSYLRKVSIKEQPMTKPGEHTRDHQYSDWILSSRMKLAGKPANQTLSCASTILRCNKNHREWRPRWILHGHRKRYFRRLAIRRHDKCLIQEQQPLKKHVHCSSMLAVVTCAVRGDTWAKQTREFPRKKPARYRRCEICQARLRILGDQAARRVRLAFDMRTVPWYLRALG